MDDYGEDIRKSRERPLTSNSRFQRPTKAEGGGGGRRRVLDDYEEDDDGGGSRPHHSDNDGYSPPRSSGNKGE